ASSIRSVKTTRRKDGNQEIERNRSAMGVTILKESKFSIAGIWTILVRRSSSNRVHSLSIRTGPLLVVWLDSPESISLNVCLALRRGKIAGELYRSRKRISKGSQPSANGTGR